MRVMFKSCFLTRHAVLFLPCAVLLLLGFSSVNRDGEAIVKNNAFFSAGSSAGGPGPSVQENCLDHACFQTRFSLFGQNLRLRGIANRDFLWAKVYSLAFYDAETSAGFDRGVPQGTKMVVMEYHRPVEKQRIIASIMENVRQNPDVDMDKVKDGFDRLTRAFDPPGEGDRYAFLFVPGEGTSMIRGETIRVKIPGEDFAFAFFGIWLSSHTGDQGRRMQLLGERV